LEEYGERACRSLENKHPGATWMMKQNGIEIMDDKEQIIALDIGKDLFVEDIRPLGKIQEMYPYHSMKFYQAYWKPIVEGIGHCSVGDNSNILHLGEKCLPDIPKEFPFESDRYNTISKKSKTPTPFTVSFKGSPAAWFVKEVSLEKTASSKYSKEDYYKNGKGAIVVCTDPTLQSYYENTGHVVQVVPFEEHLEVDIDFGNHICRMVEAQFEILDDL
jgi:hypothetical protein